MTTAGAGRRIARDRDPGRRPSAGGRILVPLLGLLGRLPERPLVAAAEATGELWYRVAPARVARARHNLRIVAASLAASGRGPALARRAATTPEDLERLVRATFRHAVRYYLEVARSDGLDAEAVLGRLEVETPGPVELVLRGRAPVILVGAHFGSLELPAIYLSSRTGYPVTGPMELVDDPALRAWFVETRRRAGVRIVPLRDARREMTAALRRGESVGIIADRDLTGGGVVVPFFGRPVRMPIGPALLALETGAPLYVGGVRRGHGGRYLGRLGAVGPVVADRGSEATRREQVVAVTAAVAAALESVIADAPEQWWGAFHPFWPDPALGDRPLSHAPGGRPARIAAGPAAAAHVGSGETARAGPPGPGAEGGADEAVNIGGPGAERPGPSASGQAEAGHVAPTRAVPSSPARSSPGTAPTAVGRGSRP